MALFKKQPKEVKDKVQPDVNQKRQTSLEDEYLEQEFHFDDFKRLARYLKPYLKPSLIVFISIIITNLFGLVIPYLTKLSIVEIFSRIYKRCPSHISTVDRMVKS